jgi:hypothetical protein
LKCRYHCWLGASEYAGSNSRVYAGLYRRGKMATVLAASTALPLRMLGQRGSTFKRRRGARCAKLESVLVVTGGELDAMAWLMATGTRHLPHARSDPAPSVPPRLGLFAISLSLLHPATSLPLLPTTGSRKASSSVACKRHGVLLNVCWRAGLGSCDSVATADSPSKRDRGRRATVSGTARAYGRLSSDCRHRG